MLAVVLFVEGTFWKWMINLIFCYLKVSDSGEVLRDLTCENQNVQVSIIVFTMRQYFSVPYTCRKGGNEVFFFAVTTS